MCEKRFEKLYEEKFDPWDYLSSPYEQEKYQTTIDLLPKAHYGGILEVGCSIGVLAAKLAQKADHVTAIDCCEKALERARYLHRDNKKIEFKRCLLPQEWIKHQTYDCIIFSEILYYFEKEGIARLADLTNKSLSPGGDCILVNYRALIEEQLQGIEAADLFCEKFGAALAPHRRIYKEKYCIDILTKSKEPLNR